MSYLDLEARRIPGPGTYEDQKCTITPKWTFKSRASTERTPRYKIVFPLTTSTTKNIVPGPGAHNISTSMDPYGRYALSKYKNSRSKVWNPQKSSRFRRSVTEGPGPGTYEPNNGMSNSGHYVLSNNISSGKRIILNSGRSCFTDETAKLSQSIFPY